MCENDGIYFYDENLSSTPLTGDTTDNALSLVSLQLFSWIIIILCFCYKGVC